MSMADSVLNHEQRLRRYLKRRIRDPHLVDDLYQEVVAVCLERQRETHQVPHAGYAVAVAKNAFSDQLRRQARHNKFVSQRTREAAPSARRGRDATPVLRRHGSDGTVAQDRPVEHREEQVLFEQQVCHLPALYREVLDLRLGKDWSLLQIAQALGRPLNTIKTQLRRAVRLLQFERTDMR